MDELNIATSVSTAFLALGAITLGVGIGIFLAVFFRDHWDIGPEEDISEERFKELAREILAMNAQGHQRRKYDRVEP